jgi:murein DD-endopeptidase MepM/ murein hydrolase activator NlpD
MRRFTSIISFILIAVALAPAHIVNAMQIDIAPQEIQQGNAFAITVNGSGTEPSASFNGSAIIFSKCGDSCFIGIGAAPLEMPAGKYNIEISAGNSKIEREIAVFDGKFEVIKLTLPESKVTLSRQDAERAKREAEKLNALWQIKTGKSYDGNFIIPLNNELSTGFGVKRIINNKNTSIHMGVDIRGKSGDPVAAANSGIVVLAEELFYGGNTVIIDHGLGIYSVYMHLSEFNAKSGDPVSKGSVVGYVGSTGRSTGPHLHFGMKIGSLSINPVSVIQLKLSDSGHFYDK